MPEQDKNKKIKIAEENIDTGIIVPVSSINKSNIENRHVESVLSGLNLKESICRKGNSLFWKDGRKKENCILNEEEDESLINIKSSIENKPAKNLDKRNRILFYLESHENGNSYLQGSSYSQGVREKIAYVLSNKYLLDEKLTDELYKVCLTKACSTEEDRKTKGDAIVRVAKKIRDEQDEIMKNTKLNDAGIKKNDQTENSPKWWEKNLNSEKGKDSSKLKESYDEVLNTFRGRDLKMSFFEINGKIIGKNYEIKAVKSILKKSGETQPKRKNFNKHLTFDESAGVSVLPFYKDMPCNKDNVSSTFAISKKEALSKKEKIDFTDKNRSENKKLIEARIRNRTKNNKKQRKTDKKCNLRDILIYTCVSHIEEDVLLFIDEIHHFQQGSVRSIASRHIERINEANMCPIAHNY